MRRAPLVAILMFLWAAILLVAGGTRAAGPADAGAHADAETADALTSADAPAEASEADAAALIAARTELRALLAFADAKSGPLKSPELFRVDLRDDDAVAHRLLEVKKDLDAARRAARMVKSTGAPHDAGPDADAAAPVDAWLLDAPPSDDVALLLHARALEVRAGILALSHDARAKLLDAEQEAIRVEAARRERERAEREAQDVEEARLRALQAAQEARSGTERRIAEIRAAVETAHGAQLRYRAKLAERREYLTSRQADTDTFLESAKGKSEALTNGSAAADALYDRVVDRLVDLRARGETLLGDIEHGGHAPRPEGDLDLPTTTDPELLRESDKLRESIRSLNEAASSLDSEDSELAWSSLRAVMQSERAMNDMRIALLARVSDEKHAAVLGFGDEGRGQMLRELKRMRLEVRWLRASGWRDVRAALVDLRRPASLARVSAQLLALLALGAANLFVRRRLQMWLAALGVVSARVLRRPVALRAVQRFIRIVDAVRPELVWLATVLLIPTVTQLDLRAGALAVPYTLLLWYSIYRLTLTATHRGLAWAAMQGESALADDTSARIVRSVRLVGRLAFVFAFVLAGAAEVVGRGYLYALVVRAAWIVGALVALVLVRMWREDIATAYLRVKPTGGLSTLVDQTRARWIGFFVAIAAFGVLLAAGILRVLRRFVLGFEHSRKALAYLFRRRLEKQVEHAAAPSERLDDKTLAFFTEAPVDDAQLVIDRYPGLSDLEKRVADWADGKRVGATLVVGRTGYGKTSWLAAASHLVGSLPVVRVALRDRSTTAEGVLSVLASALEAPSDARDVDSLASFLGKGPRRVVMVDDAQLWFLRGVETLAGWRAFSLLIERTADKVLWLVAFAHYPWEFLSWISKGDVVFREIVRLKPWSEGEISSLLERRNHASGLSLVYDDLLVHQLEGADVGAQVLSTARDYNRLVWDYAEGSPRVALHVWGMSLAPDGEGRARVRLFANADGSELESFSESARLVLAAVVWHERLSVEEAATTLLLPRLACEDTFDRLLEHGIGRIERGQLLITPLWWPVVVRYLRRKHLIES